MQRASRHSRSTRGNRYRGPTSHSHQHDLVDVEVLELDFLESSTTFMETEDVQDLWEMYWGMRRSGRGETRDERAMKIARDPNAIETCGNGKYKVTSQTFRNVKYAVDMRSRSCSCPDFLNRRSDCKHIKAVDIREMDVLHQRAHQAPPPGDEEDQQIPPSLSSVVPNSANQQQLRRQRSNRPERPQRQNPARQQQAARNQQPRRQHHRRTSLRRDMDQPMPDATEFNNGDTNDYDEVIFTIDSPRASDSQNNATGSSQQHQQGAHVAQQERQATATTTNENRGHSAVHNEVIHREAPPRRPRRPRMRSRHAHLFSDFTVDFDGSDWISMAFQATLEDDAQWEENYIVRPSEARRRARRNRPAHSRFDDYDELLTIAQEFSFEHDR
eukprot:GEZU01022764.1.p1 GENE.GEZU01022764.1~~GEZU01022764.1.p1  ORF type:complete len:386 (-),score=32.09 GEZU01022764.1:93-1250(-)